MTSIAQYTPHQQSLINSFKGKDVSTITPKEKAATTVLIKSIVRNKDTALLEELMPKFAEYYEINKTKSDKSTF
jgi:ribosomal protein S26